MPSLGDRVTHEHHALFPRCGWTQFQIVLLESSEPRKICEQLRIVLAPVVVVGVFCGRRWRWRRGFGFGHVAGFLSGEINRGKRDGEGKREDKTTQSKSVHRDVSVD